MPRYLRGSGALAAALGVWNLDLGPYALRRPRYSYKAMYHVLAQHSPVAHGHEVQHLSLDMLSFHCGWPRIVDGPYNQCRHPMYAGMLGTMWGCGVMASPGLRV